MKGMLNLRDLSFRKRVLILNGFSYLRRPLEFSAAKVISNSSKKTRDTVPVFIAKLAWEGLKLKGTYWIHDPLPSALLHQALVRAVTEQQDTLHTLLLCFPMAYLKFQDLHSNCVCSVRLCKIRIGYGWREPMVLELRPTTESWLSHFLAVQIWAHP